MALIATKASEKRKPPFLPIAILEQLKCMDCKGYLSTPPILKHPELGSICGNCVPYNENKQFIRNTEYETIAQFVEFPCKNTGCRIRIPFGKMDKHDLKCLFRPYECPLLITCQWLGNSRELRTHFRENHAAFLILNNKFTPDLCRNKTEIRLLLLENDSFFVQTKCNVMAFKLWCLVSYIGDPGLSNQFKYKLQINGDRKGVKPYFTDEKVTQTDILNVMNEFAAIEIDIPTMLRSLKCPQRIQCTIHIHSI